MTEEVTKSDVPPKTEFLDENIKPSATFANDVQPPHKDDVTGHDEACEDGEAIQGMAVTDPTELPGNVKKKKKNKRRSAGKRGIGKPTGMEEFYADAPMTPEEWQEVQKAYDRRMLTAMQRFERARKLTPERRDVFYKWLHYGGIIISPQVGTGAQNQEEMDKDEIATSLSHVLIPDELREGLESVETDEATYAVDFLGCTRSFLSRIVPVLYALDTKASAEEVTTTCERFMDYLLQHDVCPEYNEQILETRNFCRQASTPLWYSVQAQRWLPGDFNVACSTLFGGSYATNFGTPGEWDNQTNDGSAFFAGQSEEEAKSILSYGVAGAASDLVYEKYFEFSQSESQEGGLEVVDVQENVGFEIVAIHEPTDACKALYKENSESHRPVGRVIAKPWRDPGGPAEDLTAEEKMDRMVQSTEEVEPYVFFIEEIVLQNLAVGQKVIATIRKLNCGIWFFDDLAKVFPDFDLWLLNELVEDWKPPRWLKGAYVPGAPDWEEFMSREKAPDPVAGKGQEDAT